MPQGRKPKTDLGRKSHYISFRARGDLRDRLAGSATGHDRSLSEEIEDRLEASFAHETRIAELNDRIRWFEARAKDDRRMMGEQLALLSRLARKLPDDVRDEPASERPTPSRETLIEALQRSMAADSEAPKRAATAPPAKQVRT